MQDDANVLVAREELKATLDSIHSQEQNATFTERCHLDPAIPITFTKVGLIECPLSCEKYTLLCPGQPSSHRTEDGDAGRDARSGKRRKNEHFVSIEARRVCAVDSYHR